MERSVPNVQGENNSGEKIYGLPAEKVIAMAHSRRERMRRWAETSRTLKSLVGQSKPRF